MPLFIYTIYVPTKAVYPKFKCKFKLNRLDFVCTGYGNCSCGFCAMPRIRGLVGWSVGFACNLRACDVHSMWDPMIFAHHFLVLFEMLHQMLECVFGLCGIFMESNGNQHIIPAANDIIILIDWIWMRIYYWCIISDWIGNLHVIHCYWCKYSWIFSLHSINQSINQPTNRHVYGCSMCSGEHNTIQHSQKNNSLWQ